MVPGPCNVPIPFFRLLLKKAVHGPEEESWIRFLSLVNQPSKPHDPPPARNPRFRWQVTMSGARASNEENEEDDEEDDEEELRKGMKKAQEKRARFMDQKVKEQLLKRAERFEAERVGKMRRACFPVAVGCHKEMLARLLAKEAKDEEEDEEEPTLARSKRTTVSIFDRVDSDDSDDDQAP